MAEIEKMAALHPKITEALEVINAGEPNDFLRHRAWRTIERVLRLNGYIGAVRFEAYFDALVDPITICFATENEEPILRSVMLLLVKLITISPGNNLGTLRVNRVANGSLVDGDIRLKLVLEMLCPIVVRVMFQYQLTGAIDTVERMILSGVRNTECGGPEGRETFIQILMDKCGNKNLREHFKDEVVRRLVKRLHMINKKDGEQNADFVAEVERFLKQKEIKRCIVLDIVGTTTPISFVTDVLLKYSCENVGRHLDLTYDSTETQDDINLLQYQVLYDLQQGIAGAVPIPSKYAGKEALIAALVPNVQAMIRADREITASKKLLVHTVRTGLRNNEIEMQVFYDVPKALQKWHASGIKVYIYSSISRFAQRHFFGNTDYGDLRKYLCGFFDSVVGNKKETTSYLEISKFLGVDKPLDILFVMDDYEEAIAAKAGGFEVILSVRPGNGLLAENHGFKTVNSFLEI